MKVKLKNANAASRFLLSHGEKLGIAVVGALALLLIWKSLGREKLGEDKQPPALTQRASSALDQVTSTTWQNLPEEERTIARETLGDVSAKVLTPVKVADFPTLDRPLDPRVTIPLSKRQDPVLLAPLDPEVEGGAGLWLSGDPDMLNKKRLEAIDEQQKDAMKREAERRAAEREAEDRRGRGRGRRGEDGDFGNRSMMAEGTLGGMKTKDGAIIERPATGAQLQGFEHVSNRYWVTVLAKVPIARQNQMYEDALANTRGYSPATDTPTYVGYQVERAEVTDKGQGPWQSLGSVVPEAVAKVMNTWPIQTPELINPRYVHPLLTFPLPPMVVRQWDEDVTHSDLPLQTPEELMQAQEPLEPETTPAPEEGDPADVDVFAKAVERRTAASNPYSRMNPEMGGRMGLEGGGMYGGGSILSSRSYGGEGGRMVGTDLGTDGSFVLPPYNWDGRTEFLLFRYFDTRVTPGKQYRYRVRLVLADVNAQQPEFMLDPKVLERKQKNKSPYFFTDWSEESRVATVPQPGLVFIKGAKLSSNPNAEPEAELLVKSLDSEYAAEIALLDEFTRGAVLNLKQKAQVIWSSLYDPQEQPESPDFEFFTGLTLVDFDGGEKLTNRSLLAPVRALLMDASGRMSLHNELEDERPVQEFTAIIEASKAASRRNNDDRRGGNRGFGMER